MDSAPFPPHKYCATLSHSTPLTVLYSLLKEWTAAGWPGWRDAL